jgi:hypothetical protein
MWPSRCAQASNALRMSILYLSGTGNLPYGNTNINSCHTAIPLCSSKVTLRDGPLGLPQLLHFTTIGPKYCLGGRVFII